MTLIQSMNISRESLVNNQYALTVISHNVANVNTSGYSRQRVAFEQINTSYPGSSVAAVIYGLGGAKISGIETYANSAMNESVRNANSEAQYYNQLASMMGDIENIIDQLDEDGLMMTFSDFYTAAQNLTNSPTDSSVRQTYYIAANNLVKEFNYLANTLTEQKEEIAGNRLLASTAQDSLIGVSTELVNQKLEQLAKLNNSITKMSSSITGSTNALVDERNAILEELSSYMPIKIKEENYGAVTVMLGDVGLVRGSVLVNELGVKEGTSDDEPIIVQAIARDTGNIAADNLNSYFDENGSIGAQLAMVTTKDDVISINTLIGQLDNLANSFSSAVNAIQTYQDAISGVKACYLTVDGNGNTILSDQIPPAFFEGAGAAGIKITDDIKNDYNKIAAARVDTSIAGWEKNAGNSSNSLLIAQMRNEYVVDSTQSFPPVPNSTVESYLTSITTDFAAQLSDIKAKKELGASILNSAMTDRDSSISVNIDEELADMIKYQRAYEASARIFSATNEVMQTLITLGR